MARNVDGNGGWVWFIGQWREVAKVGDSGGQRGKELVGFRRK